MGINGISTGYLATYLARSTEKGTAKNEFAEHIAKMAETNKWQNSSQASKIDVNAAMNAFLVSSAYRGQKIGSDEGIKPVETERYSIYETEYGDLRIYDKENKEGFIWELDKNQIQVDSKTGTKFLINDWGNGFFNMVAVDEELEKGLKEALGVEELAEKELTGFTVHQDAKTGIKYITANGFESRGGLLVLDQEARKSLDSMAKEYLKEYPNLVKDYNEAWFYATFEVRGLAKRSANGITMISPNSLTFMHKDGVHRWLATFNEENWEKVKEAFDNNAGNAGAEIWEFWEQLFHGMKLGVYRVMPDAY